MLGLLKKTILKNKQAAIKKRYPQVNIVLHPDMPSPSMNKMVETSRIVDQVNSLEAEISVLSDSELKQKKDKFKKHIISKSAEFSSELESLQEEMLLVAMPEEKEKIKERLKTTRNKIFADILPEAFAEIGRAHV